MTSRSEVAPPPHPAAATTAMTTQRPRLVMRRNPRWKPLAETDASATRGASLESAATEYPTLGGRHGALPGGSVRRVPVAPPGQPNKIETREPHARTWSQGPPGGRPAFRPPDAPLGSPHAPLHLRRARWDPHHRPAADGPASGRGATVRCRHGQQGRDDPVRRDQEAGARRDQGMGGALRDALREPALAGRPVDELPDDLRSDRAPARADRAARRGAARPAAHQGAHAKRGGAPEAGVQPRRGARHEEADPGRADHRSEDGG